MPKRKQPKICTEGIPAKVIEASNALPAVEAPVQGNDRTREETLKGGDISKGSIGGE